MAYVECRERKNGPRYRGMYKAADGRYRSAGTFTDEDRALEVAKAAEEHVRELIAGLGQSDLRTTTRYVHVLDEEGASAAQRFEGLLPDLES
ncbi:MAG: hypothetical protein JO345_10465 [Streptosporangiaceae bacterium]|nr:hypothetical protein [Streptosporangiaceae bacterium]